jgi:uncharacterized repeat protein (TIGR03806 family)
LSATGCVNPANPKEPADGLIPYEVNVALWSDGADKKRWLAVPDGTTIQVGPDGHWDLPAGSVLMKQFSLAGTLVESRLFVRHQDGDWAGYTYAWNDAQSDATLVPLLTTTNVGGQPWSIPGRSHCLQCHAAVAGRSLGTETGQLNGDALYPSTQRIANQLATLDHIGMFSAPIGDPASLARYPKIDGTDPIAQRARAYLHANCQHCHRPGGGALGTIDFRYATPFFATGVCGAQPNVSDLGVTGSTLLAPGDPTTSVVSLRMHSLDPNVRMPPLATQVVHPAGTDLVDSWIHSLTSCQ